MLLFGNYVFLEDNLPTLLNVLITCFFSFWVFFMMVLQVVNDIHMERLVAVSCVCAGVDVGISNVFGV